MRLLAFGDSITYGAWDTEGGWVERLKKRAHQATVSSRGDNKIQVINLGIGGNSSAALLARMESEIQARVSASWPFVFIVAIGTNDGRVMDGRAEVSIETFEENINAIITVSKKYTDKIVFLGLPPLGVAELNFKGQIYSDATIKQYDAVLERVVTAEGLVFLPLRSVFETAPSDNLFAYDLLHPGDEGHELIVNAVVPCLEKLGVTL